MALNLEYSECGPLSNNVYLIWDEDSKEALICDPSMDSESFVERIERHSLTLKYIVNTHGHFDHTCNNGFFKARYPDSQLLIHELDAPMLATLTETAAIFGFDAENSPVPNGFIAAEKSLALGEAVIAVLEVPGHSPGGIALVCDGFAVVGDTLFAGGIGRTDLPGGDFGALAHSIRSQLYKLPDDTVVYPGHGLRTTIGIEKHTNPFVRM